MAYFHTRSKNTNLLSEGSELCIQRGDQLQDHSTGHCRVTGPQKHPVWGLRVWRQRLRVIVARKEEPSPSHGVQSRYDVGEGDLTTRGQRRKGVLDYGPAGRQRGEGGGDVLMQSRQLMRRRFKNTLKRTLKYSHTCRTARLPFVPGSLSIRIGRR